MTGIQNRYYIWTPFGLGHGLRSRAGAQTEVFNDGDINQPDTGMWFKVDGGYLYICGNGVPEGLDRPRISVHKLATFEEAVKWMRMSVAMLDK